MIRLLLLLALLLTLRQPACAALLKNPTVSGQLKSLDIAYQKAPHTPSTGGFFSTDSLRFELKGELPAATEFEFALENLILFSDRPAQISLPRDSPNRSVPLSRDWQRGERWSHRIGVDRLSLKGRSAQFDWSVGRQAIGFGRILMFSPLDVVAPFPPDRLDTDIRPGVEALRAVHYFGRGGQLGGTIVLGDGPENHSYLLTFSTNHAGLDLLGIAGLLRDRRLIGLGIAGSLGPLGIKGELSHYQGKNGVAAGGDLHDEFAVGALELWYRFDNGLTLISEYLYNGAGAADPNGYLAALGAAAYQEGLAPLLGQEYLLLGPSWEVHPLVTLSALLILNLADHSRLLRPQIQFSLNDNLNLEVFYSFNTGAKPMSLTPAISLPQSEFGSAGDSGGLLLRWYF
jgi:hypothetical protein